MQKGVWGGYFRHREPCRQGTEGCEFRACTKHINAVCVPVAMGMRYKAGNIARGRTMPGYRELRLIHVGTGS